MDGAAKIVRFQDKSKHAKERETQHFRLALLASHATVDDILHPRRSVREDPNGNRKSALGTPHGQTTKDDELRRLRHFKEMSVGSPHHHKKAAKISPRTKNVRTKRKVEKYVRPHQVLTERQSPLVAKYSMSCPHCRSIIRLAKSRVTCIFCGNFVVGNKLGTFHSNYSPRRPHVEAERIRAQHRQRMEPLETSRNTLKSFVQRMKFVQLRPLPGADISFYKHFCGLQKEDFDREWRTRVRNDSKAVRMLQ